MHKFKLSRFLLIASSLGLQGVIGVKAEGSYLSNTARDTPPPTPLSPHPNPLLRGEGSQVPPFPTREGGLRGLGQSYSSSIAYLSFNRSAFQPANLLTFQHSNQPTFQTLTSLAKASTCPTDVEPLVSLLIRDLPSYANRVIQRSRRLSRADENYYVLVAGRPEFAPLTLGPGQYTPTPSTDVEPPQQVFLTTLERQYQGEKAVSIQHYHWLFLVETPDGWRLAMMFSRFGSASAGRPPTAPRESSNGVIGQAVNLWLRDCRAGAIRSSENRNT